MAHRLMSEIWRYTACYTKEHNDLYYVVIDRDGAIHYTNDKMVFGNWQKIDRWRHVELVLAFKLLGKDDDYNVSTLSEDITALIEDLEINQDKLDRNCEECLTLTNSKFDYECAVRNGNFKWLSAPAHAS